MVWRFEIAKACCSDPLAPVSGAEQLRAALANESDLAVFDLEGHGVLFSDQAALQRAVDFIAEY